MNSISAISQQARGCYFFDGLHLPTAISADLIIARFRATFLLLDSANIPVPFRQQ